MLKAVHAWTTIQQQRVPSLVRVGIFGSYGRGTAGFGSDLDPLLVDQQAWGGQVERLQRWLLAELPLSCDALVLTPAELNRDLRWVL